MSEKNEWSGRWRENIFSADSVLAYNRAKNIEDYFKSHGCKMKIIKHDYDPRYGNGYRFKVNIGKSDIRIEKIEKIIINAQLQLDLPHLQMHREDNFLYITTYSSQSIWDSLHYHLNHIWGTPEYQASLKTMEIVHPIGVTESNEIVMKDLTRYPHAMVNGTTQAGKSTALKCLITNLLQYSPKKINLLLADSGFQLSRFKDLPHLSYPIINDHNTLAYVLLLLEDEMNRRINWLRENPNQQSELPYIVCVIDEFLIFMDLILSNKRISSVKQTIERILRLGQNAKIHLVLVIHDINKENRKIDISDIPVKLQFERVSSRKPKNTFNSNASEEPQLQGEMDYIHHGKNYHLHGVFISDDDITEGIRGLLERHTQEELSKGELGYNIFDKDIEKKKNEKLNFFLPVSSEASTEESNDVALPYLPEVIFWTLSQKRVSANLIAKYSAAPNNYNVAKAYYTKLQDLGVVGGTPNGYSQLEVLPASMEDLSDSIKEILHKFGYSDDKIKEAFASRAKNK